MKTLLRVLRASSTVTVLSIALAGICQELVYRGIRRAIADNALAVSDAQVAAVTDAHRAMVDRSLAGEPV